MRIVIGFASSHVTDNCATIVMETHTTLQLLSKLVKTKDKKVKVLSVLFALSYIIKYLYGQCSRFCSMVLVIRIKHNGHVDVSPCNLMLHLISYLAQTNFNVRVLDH